LCRGERENALVSRTVAQKKARAPARADFGAQGARICVCARTHFSLPFFQPGQAPPGPLAAPTVSSRFCRAGERWQVAGLSLEHAAAWIAGTAGSEVPRRPKNAVSSCAQLLRARTLLRPHPKSPYEVDGASRGAWRSRSSPGDEDLTRIPLPPAADGPADLTAAGSAQREGVRSAAEPPLAFSRCS
jgi:hypothetical protein